MSERFGRMVGTKEASRDFSFVWLLVGGYYLNRRVCASGLEIGPMVVVTLEEQP